MKLFSNKALAAASIAALGLAGSLPAQTVPYTRGDIVLGVRALGGVGADQTFAYNLGFQPTFTSGVVGNIDTPMASLFGANWAQRADLVWGAVAILSEVNFYNPMFPPSAINGDPQGTLIVSKGATTPASTTPWQLNSDSGLALAFNLMLGFLEGFDGGFSTQPENQTVDNRGVIVPAAGSNSWAGKNTGGVSFGSFTAAAEDFFGIGTDYIDLYKMLGDAPRGAGTYFATVSIDDAGNVSVVSPIPEPSFATFILGLFGLGVLDRRRAA